MDILFLGIIIFLFVLAVFDLSVGVSNDAVNFLNSAIGSKAAKFRTIIIVASVGVFIGAAMSNGMMDIARHGIFRPEHFSFYDLICIFMAVMVTDIILLDVFNSLGMPTSTTVSMVFELLGAAFVIALIKMWGDQSGLSMMDLLNSDLCVYSCLSRSRLCSVRWCNSSPERYSRLNIAASLNGKSAYMAVSQPRH